MSKFAERSRKAFEAAGLFEPKTRAVKLRYSLEAIDKAQSHGASLEQIMKTLETSGLVFPSLVAFKMALTRARKAGPMLVDAEKTLLGMAKSGPPQERQQPPIQAAEPSHPGKPAESRQEEQPLMKNGVPIYRPKKVEYGTNRIPSMKDFV